MLKNSINTPLNILYINLGGTIIYVYDKPAGRILSWIKAGNNLAILAPQLDYPTIKNEILNKTESKVRVISFPFTNRIVNSKIGIIFCYLTIIILSPLILFKKIPIFDFTFSNSSFFVDILPALWLKLFKKSKYWVLMMDSVVPSPHKRRGVFLINLMTYWESKFVAKLANKYADLVFTVNPELEKEMLKRGIKKEKIVISQNGLLLNNIDVVKKSKYHQSDAVYMGRISINKGIEDLIDVWKIVVATYPDAKLTVMGTGLAE